MILIFITGLLSPDSSPKVNLRRVQSLSNKTAQSMCCIQRDMYNNSLSICLEYLDQVRTKRRSLDRNELSSSPTKEVGEESQGIRYMKTHCITLSLLYALQRINLNIRWSH